MVLAAPQRTSHPGIEQVEHQWRMHPDGRLQAVGRLPGTVAHRRYILAHSPGGLQRHGDSIAGQPIALGTHATDLDLQALQRRIDVTHIATASALLAQHMPGLKGLAQLQFNTVDCVIAHFGETKLQVRGKPLGTQGEARGVELDQNVGKILLDKVRQHEAVMQRRAPACQAFGCIGLAPEPRHQRPQQQLLGQTHARVRRHFKGAQFQQAQASGRAIRRIEFIDAEFGAVGVAGHVDQQVAQQTVNQPRYTRLARCRHLREGDFQLVQ
ncbi:hypothetical protein D3C80_1403460 [compost metagenome]